MPTIYLFNKPYLVLSQFTDKDQRSTLADFIDVKEIRPAGRLDYDSEGLMVLTADGSIQARISDPKHKLPKTYWVQVEGNISSEAISLLQKGVELKDGKTRPAKARKISPPKVWERIPPIRERVNIPTSWLELTITEGKNRQVRRMTAAVGFPTLRLIRCKIGPWSLEKLQPGESNLVQINLPKTTKGKNPSFKKKKTHYQDKKT